MNINTLWTTRKYSEIAQNEFLKSILLVWLHSNSNDKLKPLKF